MPLKTKHIIGMMSGTSLDGIDLALVKINGKGIDVEYELIAYDSYPYTNEIQNKILKQSVKETSDIEGITSLHYELGEVYSDAVARFIKEKNIKVKIDAVGLHGQTIHHLPDQNPKATLQIGSASHIAFHHRTTVVSNFREMDIVAGGEGAPLVPYTDYVMFKNKIGMMLVNIGGIANVTVIPKDGSINDIYAFDTGPGNMMMNAAMNIFYNKTYDKDGAVASKGVRIESLYEKLLSNPYIDQLPPKSTGREMFGEDVVKEICEAYSDRQEDVLFTLTEFTAETIYQSYVKFIKDNTNIQQVVISGGGAYNPILMKALTDRFEQKVLTQEDLGYSSDAKEAVAFALLANDTLEHVPNNSTSATGADAAVILGQITRNPRGV